MHSLPRAFVRCAIYNTRWKKIVSRFPTLNRDSLPIVKMRDTPFLTVHFVGNCGNNSAGFANLFIFICVANWKKNVIKIKTST